MSPEHREERNSEGSELMDGAGRELLSWGLPILHKSLSLQRTGIDEVRLLMVPIVIAGFLGADDQLGPIFPGWRDGSADKGTCLQA